MSADLPAWLDTYIGIPFAEHGRDRAGCDCFGLFRMILAERAGLELPAFSGAYESTRDGPTIEGLLAAHGGDWREVAAGSERLFDGILLTGFFRAAGVTRRADMHVGLVVAPAWMVHVEREVDTCRVNYRKHAGIRHRVIGFYRHERLANG